MKHLVRTLARVLLPVVMLIAAGASVQAQEPLGTPQREHVVRRGDTLWDLARAYLSNPFLWRQIYDANRDVVENPHWIYPAERLIIPPLAGAEAPPRDLPAPLGTPAVEALGAPIGDPLGAEAGRPIGEPMGAPQLLGEPLATLDLRQPVVTEAEYLSAPWLSTTTRSQVMGRLLRLADPATTDDWLTSTMLPMDRVYVGHMSTYRPNVGDQLVVVRFGRTVADRGEVVEPMAVLEVESLSRDVATTRVVRQYGPARVGDEVIWLEPLPDIGLGEPVPVEDGMGGDLLGFVREETLYGTTDLGFISLGSASGVGIGDEFEVYVPARTIMDDGRAHELPPEDVGAVRVVKVGDRTSTVRVLRMNSTALRGGLAVRATRRMP